MLYYYYHYCGVSPLSPCFAFLSALFNCQTVSQQRIRPQLHFQNKACLKTLLMFYHEIWSSDLAGKRLQQLAEQWKSKRLHKVLSWFFMRDLTLWYVTVRRRCEASQMIIGTCSQSSECVKSDLAWLFHSKVQSSSQAATSGNSHHYLRFVFLNPFSV